jgi:hypothetical protein
MMRGAKAALGLAMAIVLTGAASASAEILPTAIWHLNTGTGTTAYDISGHHNDGTLQSGAKWTSGRFQGAVAFDGVASQIRVPDSASLDSAAVTVSAWVNATAPGNFKYIVAKGASGCAAGSYGLYTGAKGGLQFYTSTAMGSSWTTSPDAGPALWNGQWHNVIGTFDGSTVRLFVDGQQVGSGTPDSSPIGYGLVTSNDLLIGNYTGCPGGLDFPGKIDEVKIFNRALGDNEIKLTYGISRLLPTILPFDLVL